MKASLIVLFLVSLLTGCQPKTVQPPERDAATIMAGRYQLIKARAHGSDAATDFYKPHTTLVLTRITATSVKATYTFPTGTNPSSETWTLKKVSDESVEVSGQSSYVEYYQKGEVKIILADGTLNLWFEQLKP